MGGDSPNPVDDLHCELKKLGLKNAYPMTGQYSYSDMAIMNNYFDAQIFPSRAEDGACLCSRE